MSGHEPYDVLSAQAVLPCSELDATLAFFTGRLGFRIDAIHPADDPQVAELSGHGVCLRLARGAPGPPGRLRLRCAGVERETSVTAPNGTRVDLVPAEAGIVLPPLVPALVVSRMGADAAWGTGRAGMRYRDLVPDRLGGRFIASHIRIPDGGPVPDYVHYHEIRFQMIYCYKGWVRVVYEDQGPPFTMQAGDCVLQPPRIRHRVLESSPGLEVIEIGCPAEHLTRVDHDLELPTQALHPDRDFGGQRFVRHEAAAATWVPWRIDGFESRDIGIEAATGGLAGVQVARRAGDAGAPDTAPRRHDAEFLLDFVLQGTVSLRVENRGDEALHAGDCFVVPAGTGHALADCSPDLEVLEVALPARFEATPSGTDANRRP